MKTHFLQSIVLSFVALSLCYVNSHVMAFRWQQNRALCSDADIHHTLSVTHFLFVYYGPYQMRLFHE